ncbi:hypothetical protein L5515_007338 [Caenorhabditis briggsae]|uniref:Serine aminopeptidase S33 domain-containing protein n=1 Tax=Caenorhabditis briggsae TaxID=6238 RepID=A0AAE9JKR4_CAEBR|nr:hypothetical protein L3Y34_007489 [Caenorhabditis briggsae]UMM34142.1 hypothetical protein L5515_007338 [Caenorhabditis briggsae]
MLLNFKHSSNNKTTFTLKRSLDHVWNVNEWRRDIEERINANNEKWILMATSGACHPALNIAKQHKEKVSGLFLMCPGTGLDMSFVDTIQPGALKYLMKTGSIKYPPSKHGHPALLNIECLQDFLKTSICNSPEKTIDITCPVLIVHGEDDNIVPIENSNKLMQRIASTCKDFYRIPGVDHYFDLDEQVLKRLEKLMDTIRDNQQPQNIRAKI